MSESKCGCTPGSEFDIVSRSIPVFDLDCTFPQLKTDFSEALRLINALIMAQAFRRELGDEAQEFVEKHK